MITGVPGDVPVPYTAVGLVLLVLAGLGRLAVAAGLSPLPVPLFVGLLVARGGPLPDSLRPPAAVLDVGAPLALAILLLCLGLEHTRSDRRDVVRHSAPLGAVDAAANFLPGALTGLVLGWDLRGALLLGGATWSSSSGVVRHLIGALGRVGNRETPGVLAVLALEHLGMAVFLPLATAVLAEGGGAQTAAALLASTAAVGGAVWAGREHGPAVRRAIFGAGRCGPPSLPEPGDALLALLGAVLLGTGLLGELRVAAPAGAYLIGFVLAGPVTATPPARTVLPVLRQAALIAGLFLFGAAVDVGRISAGLLGVAAGLAAVTTGTKLLTGWCVARSEGVGRGGRWRAGTALAGRGEFAVVLGLIGATAAVEPDLAPLVAVYVVLTAVAAPLLSSRTPGAGNVRATPAPIPPAPVQPAPDPPTGAAPPPRAPRLPGSR